MTKENENELVHLIDTLFKNSFIGARPLALTGNQPGVGKTMLPFIRQQINLIFKKKKDFFFKKKKRHR
ncbi:hypothetical protein KA977_01960 [Candidatus Dependentiae bacterium]|nr:hypothetical protein [Candidatus Dependentiae bacterium]